MTIAIPVQFPPGLILDRDAFVWTTLPPGTGLLDARIVGTCSIDPLELSLVQVTVEHEGWSRDLLPPGQEASFPLDRGFALAVPGFNAIDQLAWRLAAARARITVHVRRSSRGEATFQLTLLVSDVEIEETAWRR